MADPPGRAPDAPSDVDRHLAKVKGCLFAAHGVYLVAAGLALAVLCWLLPGLLAKIVSSEAVDRSRLPGLALAVLDRRPLAPLLALPTLLAGVLLLLKLPWRWLWLVLGMLLMVPPAVLMLYLFVVALRGLYDPAPL